MDETKNDTTHHRQPNEKIQAERPSRVGHQQGSRGFCPTG